jgi:hypothetical protein
MVVDSSMVIFIAVIANRTVTAIEGLVLMIMTSSHLRLGAP